MFGIWNKTDIPSKYINEQACSHIGIIRFITQVTYTSTTTNYANVAYNLLPYKTASATMTTDSNSK